MVILRLEIPETQFSELALVNAYKNAYLYLKRHPFFLSTTINLDNIFYRDHTVMTNEHVLFSNNH